MYIIQFESFNILKQIRNPIGVELQLRMTFQMTKGLALAKIPVSLRLIQ